MTRSEHRDEALRLLAGAPSAYEDLALALHAVARAHVHALLALSADQVDGRTVFSGGDPT